MTNSTNRQTHPKRGARIVRAALAAAALACACASCIAVPCSFAQSLGDLEWSYQAAVGVYWDAVQAQEEGEAELQDMEEQVQATEQDLAEEQQRLEESTVKMYKSYPGRGKILDMLLNCDSIDEAAACFEDYQRIERYYLKAVESLQGKRAQLAEQKQQLEDKRDVLAGNVAQAMDGVIAAQNAYLEADHSDGALFHQRQGTSNNCGATAFAVGVNILLHENRFFDNVAVWSGPGFNGDSTTDLANKGLLWLASMGLSDQIGVRAIPGDIHFAEQLRDELEQGNVVVISSGSGSTWNYADGSSVPGLFPAGHWIVFYQYRDGIFYANDSSTSAERGAGCPYDWSQMQQWLDGRSNHFAVSIAKLQG